MPSREPELYKDKIEVSLDGRQIFYLFFGGAVIVGLVFVLGVMVGRRVEARGHLDRAETQTARDPLAALDRLERPDKLSFHGALTGNEAPTDVERAIGEFDKRRAAARPDPKAARPEGKLDAKLEAKLEAKLDKAEPKADKPDGKLDAKADKAVPKADKAEPVTHPDVDKPRPDKHDGDKHDGDKHDGDKHDGDKHDADKRAKKHDDTSSVEARSDARLEHAEARHSDKSDKSDKPDKPDKPATRPDDARPSDGKTRFTLQLSSFQDRSEAEAFLSATKSAGYQPYLTEAEVSGKGTFYRVRLGLYRSLEAASDAKAEYEKAAKKSAQVMRL